MTAPQGDTGTLVRGGTWLAVAMGVMNIATYGFTMIAARLLGPEVYGPLGAMMATLLVVSVLQLGLQATAARRISADPGHVAQIERSILALTYRAALAVGLLMLALVPVVNLVLRLDSLMTAAVMALTAVPITILGGQLGILQGERRWLPLALLYVANGVPRLVIGVTLIWVTSTALAAMVGVAVAAWVPVLIGWLSLRSAREPGTVSEDHRVWPTFREVIHNSQALLAFFALTTIDLVIVARNVLTDHESGLYAGGLIITKAMLFLPQFVVIVAFPAMSTPAERRWALTRSVSLIVALGALGSAAVFLLPDLALIFIGGADYTSVKNELWLFAILGTFQALLQLLIYSVLARRGQRSAYLVWLAVLALVGAGLTTSTVAGLLAVTLIVDAAITLMLLGISLWLVKHPDKEPV